MTIIALYAAPLALLYFALTVNVIRLRYKHQISLGTGTIPELERAIRAHGNFAEYIPFTLLLIGCSEYLNAPSFLIHLFGGALMIARLLHASCLCIKYNVRFRQIGVITTLLTLLLSALSSFFLALS